MFKLNKLLICLSNDKFLSYIYNLSYQFKMYELSKFINELSQNSTNLVSLYFKAN